jgi:hypothetical protein
MLFSTRLRKTQKLGNTMSRKNVVNQAFYIAQGRVGRRYMGICNVSR